MEIKIKGWQVPIKIGWGIQERQHPQIVEIDLSCTLNSLNSAQSDLLEDTVDYAALIDSIEKHCTHKEWRLLESFTTEVGEFVIEYSPLISEVEVEAAKKVFPQLDSVSVRRVFRRG